MNNSGHTSDHTSDHIGGDIDGHSEGSAGEHAQPIGRDRRDGLTGLGHVLAFDARLNDLAAHSRYAVLSIGAYDIKAAESVETYPQSSRPGADYALAEHASAERRPSTWGLAVQAVAAALNSAVRMGDCLFRTGDVEFAMVVPVRDEGDALRIAGRLQRAARRVGHPVSIGVAVSEIDDDDRRALAVRADVALAAVRQRGGNGTALSHPHQGPDHRLVSVTPI